MRCTSCSQSVKPIVAIDIDGTMAQYHRSLMRFIEIYYDRSLPAHMFTWNGLGEFSDHLGMEKHEYQAAKLAFRAGGFKRWMPAYEGGPMLCRYVKELGAELWITTTRPWMRMDSTDPDTREWLRRWHVPYDHLLYDEDKYGELCSQVDSERIMMVIDDEAVHESRCVELGIPFTLRRNEFNTGQETTHMTSNLGITSIGDVIARRIREYSSQ